MRWKFVVVVGLFELTFIIILATFVDYDERSKPKQVQNRAFFDTPFADDRALFQDIHSMIFFGIGFLYTFIRRYCYSGVAMTMLLASITMQISFILQNLWYIMDGKIRISMKGLIEGDFAAASSLIALGGIFGKTNPLQMVVFVILETIFYSVNQHLCVNLLLIRDFGEAIDLHLFAAIFGLSVAFVVDKGKKVKGNPNDAPSYTSNLFCLLGTVYLWVFWPTFNAVLTCDNCQRRSVINTTMALLASCIAAFVTSSALHKRGKFQMMHLQNASLAGGVAIGAVSDLMIRPFGATLLGMIGGIISTLGFTYSTPFLERKLKVYDACGINSLHAIPGLVSGIAAAIASLFATKEIYGEELYYFYPAMVPSDNTTDLFPTYAKYEKSFVSSDRSNAVQCGFQLLYILVCIISSTVTGLLTGLLLRMPFFQTLTEDEMYIDDMFYELPEVVPNVFVSNNSNSSISKKENAD